MGQIVNCHRPSCRSTTRRKELNVLVLVEESVVPEHPAAVVELYAGSVPENIKSAQWKIEGSHERFASRKPV